MLRLDAHVSIAELSRATGIDDAHISRIEAGTANPSLEVLIALGLALGADLGVRYFAGSGPRIHDRFQAPMSEAFLAALHPRWGADLEVGVSSPTRGVIDVVLHPRLAGPVIATELQSDLRRLEQQIRWGREKSEALATRLGTDVSQLLVLRSTVRTRELARQYETMMRTAFPARTADAVAALTTADATWPGPAVIWMHVEGPRASLMRHPPPGVRLGR
jgi:transcriptional regulator with XRE-family HTH domain